ncbi:MAG: hypothetical protein CMO81_02145 [Waddliaceae bacterium]|nr:hypothetical protein [Waddliaceae bacterium]
MLSLPQSGPDTVFAWDGDPQPFLERWIQRLPLSSLIFAISSIASATLAPTLSTPLAIATIFAISGSFVSTVFESLSYGNLVENLREKLPSLSHTWIETTWACSIIASSILCYPLAVSLAFGYGLTASVQEPRKVLIP